MNIAKVLQLLFYKRVCYIMPHQLNFGFGILGSLSFVLSMRNNWCGTGFHVLHNVLQSSSGVLQNEFLY